MTARAALPLLALSFTLTLSAQPAPQAQAAAAIARSLMQSKTIPDKAWGAYLAAEIPDDASLHEALISELRSATDRYYRAVLFDAIIRSQTIVPTDLLLTFGPEARDIVLILLPRNPSAEIEAPLLAMLDDARLSREQWTLVCNLLFRIDAKLLVRKALQQLAITHTLVLHSPNSGVVGGVDGCADGDGVPDREPQGFPPVIHHPLTVSAVPGSVVIADGPHPVYYLAGSTPAQKLGWNDKSCPANRDESRLDYLAALSYRSVEDLRKVFRPTDDVEWRSAKAFTAQASAILDSQTIAIRGFLNSLNTAGVDVSGLALRIEPKIIEYINVTHEPVPAIPARDITLEN